MEFATSVLRKYRSNNDKNSVRKIIFVLKNKISALASKLRRYETQQKSKRQNEMFSKNRKQFYREIETEAKFTVPAPPTEADLREFWGEKIFGQVDLYNPNADWIPEWRDKYKEIKEQDWVDIDLSQLSNQLGRQHN